MMRNIASWAVPIALLVGASGWLYMEANAVPGEWDRYGAVSERVKIGEVTARHASGAGSEVTTFSQGSQWVVQGLVATLPGASFERVTRPLATLVCVQATDRCWQAAPVEGVQVWLGAE